MKAVDITGHIANSIDKVIFEQWKHEGYIDYQTSEGVGVVIDGRYYEINL
jgi:hypothetical protein